ncbi:serine/threonine-protein phosphatase 4 regulatory subunit 2 [Impatiens glandulifera]|uniref:serine/threonine-protein phosphatase 4 regulatory subunit 2 n=1 Tax=Impatiens glandulifera TaxID=253017 RepID=UPI001FB0DEFC|nr:serine/threonine-protein phosphatase 4 regulatory subunit 2 [Impatiens glandulifera]
MSIEEDTQPSTIPPSHDAEQINDNLVNDVANYDRETEYKHGIAGEEAKSIVEVIASTGKFWHDWNKLKSLLSFYLKQVVSEYAEANMTTDEQKSSLGETYEELVKKLDNALSNFIEGPPFTLQRVCEILLDSKNIYSSLSKLALALEKNLSVTSTLTICSDPYPSRMIEQVEKVDNDSPPLQVDSVENGVEHAKDDDNDEVMTDATMTADEGEDEMTIDMVEVFEEIVVSSEESNDPVSGSPPTN